MLTYFLLILLVIFLIWIKIRRKPKEPYMLSIPTSFYNMLRILYDNENLWPSLLTMMDSCEKVGGVATTYISPFKHVIITDPEIAEVVLKTCLEKDTFYSLLDDWMKNSIFIGPVHIWRQNRKHLVPTFNPRLIESFTPLFNAQAKRFSDQLSSLAGQPFDICTHVGRNVIETLILTIFGLNGYDTKEEILNYIHAVEKFIEIATKRAINFILQSEFLFKFSSYKREYDQALKILHNSSYKIIAKRKKLRESIANNLDNAGNTNLVLPIDKLLDLQDKGIMDETKVRSEIDALLFGGHDTSAGVARIFLMLLGAHDNVQDKLYDEISKVMDGANDNLYVTKHHLSQLRYLDAVLKESMRLYPIAPLTGRMADKDVVIKDYIIPKGSSWAIMHYKMHRHPIWGPDADQFRPERWLELGGVPSSGAVFSPFGWGKRNCIGQAYGMMLMKVMLVHLLNRYRVHSDLSNLQWKYQMFLTPSSGHLITLNPRIK